MGDNLEDLIDAVVDRVLLDGLDDWVYLAGISSALIVHAESVGVQLWYKNNPYLQVQTVVDDPWLDVRIGLGMRVVKALLGRHLMVPGDLAPRFVPWEGSYESWLERIESGWREFGSSLSIGDVCWFDITAEGTELVRLRGLI